MAGKEREIVCRNVFKTDNPAARKAEYTKKWAELISLLEKCKGGRGG